MKMEFNLKARFEYFFQVENGINLTRMFYSIGILFVFLYLILEQILPAVAGSAVGQWVAAVNLNYQELGNIAGFFDGVEAMILPTLLLLALFAALFLIMRRKSDWKKILPFIIKSFLVTVLFSFLMLKSTYLSGLDPEAPATFAGMPFASVFGFMVLYAIPISLAIIANRDDRERIFLDLIAFVVLVLLANVPFLVSESFSTASVLFAIQELGIFYFLAVLIGLLSILDRFAADLDSGPASFLVYLGLPAYIVLVMSAFIFFILFAGINALFGTQASALVLFAPFFQLYGYLRHFVFYKDILGFIFSLLSLLAIARAALTLYKHATDAPEPDWDLSQIFRSVTGVIALGYFLSSSFPLPWCLITTGVFSAVIISLYTMIRKRVYIL